MDIFPFKQVQEYKYATFEYKMLYIELIRLRSSHIFDLTQSLS